MSKDEDARYNQPVMRLLVTGGAGFIGSHFVLRHVAMYPEDTVVVLDLLTYAGKRAFLRNVEPSITFVQGDIADTELLRTLMKEHAIDTIVNFAAESHVDRSIESAAPFLHTNVIGMQSIIEICKEFPKTRLLHVSTDEVYGDLADDEPPKKVGDALWPSSPYAASKACSEMLLLAAMRTYNIHACITRCTNNFGPHQDKEKFIPTVIRSALAGKQVPVYAKGENKRDWLYVTDHTDALERLLQTEWAFEDKAISSGHIFNISAESEKRNIDVVRMILKKLEKSEDIITFVKDRPGHDWRYALESNQIRALGWQPAVSFEQGIETTIRWYREQEEGTMQR